MKNTIINNTAPHKSTMLIIMCVQMHGTVQSTCFGQTDRPLCSISKGGRMHARLAVLDRRKPSTEKANECKRTHKCDIEMLQASAFCKTLQCWPSLTTDTGSRALSLAVNRKFYKSYHAAKNRNKGGRIKLPFQHDRGKHGIFLHSMISGIEIIDVFVQ